MSIKSITEEQILSVLSAARKHSERDYVAILVTYMHGLRATETCSLTTNNFADGFITVARLKGSLKTTHPLFSHANPLLDERTAVTDYLKTLHKGQRLCPMTRQHFHRLFKTYCAEAGVPAHCSFPHVCKHARATHLVGKIQINELQQFLGHASLSSTGAYVRTTDQQACNAVAIAMGA